MSDEMAAAATVSLLVRRELDDDYVGLWVLPWHIRRIDPNAPDERVQEIARAALEALVEQDAALGDLDEATGVFNPWPPGGAVDAAMSAWRALHRDPNIGEVAWLALTS